MDISLYQVICLLYYHEPDNRRDHMVGEYVSLIYLTRYSHTID